MGSIVRILMILLRNYWIRLMKMTKTNNLDEIDFPLIMSYEKKEDQVKYIRDILRTNLKNHISQLKEHLVPGKEGLTCPIFDRKDICTDCHIAHWLEQFLGGEEE